jgi:hypothetical protein
MLKELPWRRIGIGFAVVAALLVTGAPMRRAAALGTSRVILWLASPIWGRGTRAGAPGR